MTMSAANVFSQLLARLEAVGGQIKSATIDRTGNFEIEVDHPDVTLRHDARSARASVRFVRIECRRGQFPAVHAAVDPADIMTVIEGWMKEGGACGSAALLTPTPESSAFESAFAEENELAREAAAEREGYGLGRSLYAPPSPAQRALDRAAELKRRREGWGVDRPPESALRPLSDRQGKPYCVVIVKNVRGIPDATNAEEHWLPTLADAQWLVREAKQDARVGHIELTDHRPGGKDWYYDRDRSGFWKRTVHH